ncbi:MAG: tetratricopeptide repeat protein [Planctomycetota bacterium]|nr:tetratricopeptide repeat protein [Planctomycetota bacterium]
MSTQTPTCTKCNSTTEFAGVTRPSQTDETSYAVVWKCSSCGGEVHDPCPLGPIIPTPDSCLSCGAEIASDAENGVCNCGMNPAQAEAALGVTKMPTDPVDAARQAYESGMFRYGLALLNKTVLADPTDEAAWLGKTSFLESMKFQAAHLALLEHLATLEIGAARAIYGNRLQQQGRHEDAARHYKEFLAQMPDHELAPQVVANLAVALGELGRPKDADTHCEAAIHQEPARICHYTNYATMLAHQQRFGDAVATVDSGLVAVPGIPARIHLLETRSMILSDMERGQDALLTIQQAIALGADSLRAHFCLGRALALVGELGPAREEIGYVLEQDPDNVFAQQAMEALDKALKAP